MIRRAWVLATGLIALAWPSYIVWCVAAAWEQSRRMGDVALVLFLFITPLTVFYVFWTDPKYRPAPNLPRKMRRHIRNEERRIRLEAEIHRLKREVGDR